MGINPHRCLLQTDTESNVIFGSRFCEAGEKRRFFSALQQISIFVYSDTGRSVPFKEPNLCQGTIVLCADYRRNVKGRARSIKQV